MSSELQIPEDITAMSFETALKELEVTVGKIEAGQLTMEELMKNFERGHFLMQHCRNFLAKMEKKAALLIGDDGKDGSWTDFDAASGRRD